MPQKQPFTVAIIGGGLCGLSLAIALKTRRIPFKIYEARTSFTEIGAGINVGPNGIKALRAIDPSLGEKVYQLATRNPEPFQDVWMYFKYGGKERDGEKIFTLMAPPSGTTTMHRQEFLAALAGEMGVENARFEKKLVGYEQRDGLVHMSFADGSVETASLMVGCDGIHSRVRTIMFGEGNPVSKAHFNHDGAYRAVIPIEKAIEAVRPCALSYSPALSTGITRRIFSELRGGRMRQSLKSVRMRAMRRRLGILIGVRWTVNSQADMVIGLTLLIWIG